jgi:hypothetical protein
MRDSARSVAHALLFLLLAVFLAAGTAPDARCDDDLDEVLGGFDDEAGGSSEGDAEDESTEDILQGFEEDHGEGQAAPEIAEAEKSFWDLTGSVSLGSSINYLKHRAFVAPDKSTDYAGVQRLRAKLDLQLDIDLPGSWEARVAGFGFYDFAYLANGRHDYSQEVLDMYEWQADFQEVWIRGSPLHDLDLKVGRQIVNWGRSDTLRVLDILNPLDNREPGIVDIVDLRRPVTMLNATYYYGDWSLSAIAIPEIRFSLNPPLGNDFAPVISSLGTVEAFVFPEDHPHESVSHTQWAAALSGIFSGWDVSFHFARMYRDMEYLDPRIQWIDLGALGTYPLSLEGTELRHSRITLVGSGANYTIGSWLFKGEIAWTDGIDYTTSTPINFDPIGGLPMPDGGTVPVGLGIVDVPTGTVRRSRLDFMGGVEYYGFVDTSIALEVVNRHIFGFRRDMRPLFLLRKNQLETALRITRTFLRERLEVTALGVMFGSHAQDGSIVRLDASYELRDALELSGGIIFYQKGDPPPFDTIARNDRIFVQLKYSF